MSMYLFILATGAPVLLTAPDGNLDIADYSQQIIVFCLYSVSGLPFFSEQFTTSKTRILFNYTVLKVMLL